MNLSLLYCGTKDGFKMKKFYELSSKEEKTIVIIKSENNLIFGAYCDKKWNEVDEWIEGDGKSFIFSFSKN